MTRSELTPFEIQLREIISKNLKNAMGDMTQGELSKKSGVPASTISGYIARRSSPSPGNIQKLADSLGVKKSDLDPRFLQQKEAVSNFAKTGSPQRRFLMDKLAKASDDEIDKMVKLWDFIENEINDN